MTKSLEELKAVLIEANKNGYAGDGLEIDPLLPDFKEHQHEHSSGHWITRDFNTGLYSASGFRMVWYDNKSYWMMIRGGGMTPSYVDLPKPGYDADDAFAKAVFRFQKKMLRQAPEDMPVRGPLGSHTEGHFEYRNSVLGDLRNLIGQELIVYHERSSESIVYSLDYKAFLIPK
ncbi:MAG: hypothetical protein HYW22_02655 [Candidatus Aenigmarchaeota archaeon]|nr:hypothetical protein [Candidatus Aenigmarchaeota archaeon]